MQYFDYPIFNAATNAGSGSINSTAVDARFYVNATCQAKFTDSSAAGTLKLQGSNDPTKPADNAGTWTDIPSATVTVASGATSTVPNTSVPLCFQWVRAVWSSTGGAGTFTANLHMNGY